MAGHEERERERERERENLPFLSLLQLVEWPGMSSSGSTAMPRSAAYFTISVTSSSE
jgi:hypothetical protein